MNDFVELAVFYRTTCFTKVELTSEHFNERRSESLIRSHHLYVSCDFSFESKLIYSVESSCKRMMFIKFEPFHECFD